MKNYFVTLNPDSPFYRMFPAGLVPVKQVASKDGFWTRGVPMRQAFITRALCGDAREPEPCVWLDWTRIAPGLRLALAKEVCRLRGGNSRDFLSHMDRGGDMPIRVSQTTGNPFPL